MLIDKLLKNSSFILDGAMGTTLQAMGLKPGEKPELLCQTKPEVIKKVHESFVSAGAQAIYTNTFGANREKLEGESVERIIAAALDIAKEAASDKAAVILDVGPIGKLLAPYGELTFDAAYEIFKEVVTVGEKHGADAVVFETFSSLSELRAAMLAAKENTALPVLATMTFEANGRTYLGVTPSAFSLTASGLGAAAVGANCSLGPKALLPIVEEISRYTDLPVIAKPNAGLPDLDGHYSITPEEFSRECMLLKEAGATVLGGCCGTTPEFISGLKRLTSAVASRKRPKKQEALCSSSKTVLLNRPLIVGERLNPTGKKALKEAYLSGDDKYIIEQAIEQERAGAAILDVNVGVPGADETELMQKTVKTVSHALSLPLSIDSSSVAALEAGLRFFDGKAIINSVNGEEKSLKEVLPLAKKYGAAIIGLCLDERGVPKTSDERFEIAKRIVDKATACGIDKSDIFIDCLTLTVSAEKEQARETLAALKRVKEELNVKTALGVSNVSFGLPNRDRVSSAFLTAAMHAGLDLAIINPNSEAMAYAYRASMLLLGYDDGASEYIKACADEEMKKTFTLSNAGSTLAAANDEAPIRHELTELLVKGMDIENETKRLLANLSPLDVVNGHLIPALDAVGRLYETGKLFLPQLITAAEKAKKGFAAVKRAIKEKGGYAEKGDVIVLATVKGDVHDIGKNIVKVVLENYGYTVIDLGKNVDEDDIAMAVKEHEARLLGLSALMTTTVSSMESAIRKVNAAVPVCKIMVGGAVLTEEYAKRIGADFYAKDANAAVAIARKVFTE